MNALKGKLLSWLLAFALLAGMVPVATLPAAAAPAGDGGSVTEAQADLLLAGAGKTLAEIAIENGYLDYDTVDKQGGSSHMQGICVDDELKYMYFSYTDVLVKLDMATGEVVGSVGGFGAGSFGTPGGGHLGCLDYYDGWIYGSLEYKAPAAKWFVCAFDASMITEKGMLISDDEVFGNGGVNGMFLKEASLDFRDPLNFGGETATNGANDGHRYCIGGVDGVTFGTYPGDDSGEIYLIITYGVYANFANRYDDKYTVIQFFDVDKFWDGEKPVGTQNIRFTYERGLDRNYTEEECLVSDKQLYVWFGNNSWGTQNLEYEWDTGDLVMYTYGSTEGWEGVKSMFVIDGSADPVMKELQVGQNNEDPDPTVQAKAKALAECYLEDTDGDGTPDAYPVVPHAVLKCVCGNPDCHVANVVGDTEWGTSGVKKAEYPICSISNPASATYGIHWLCADPYEEGVDYFYIANGDHTAGLYRRVFKDNSIAFGRVSAPPANAEELTAKPILHWTMDAADLNGEGEIANVAGEGYDGYYANVDVTKGADGKAGGALSFDGTAAALDYSRVWLGEEDIKALNEDIDRQVTISFWYKSAKVGAANYTSTWVPLVGLYSDGEWIDGPGHFVLVAEARYNMLTMCMNNYGAKTDWPRDIRSASTGVGTDTLWHHIAMTVDLDTTDPTTGLTGGTSLYRRFYVDGVEVKQERALYPENINYVLAGISDFEIGGVGLKCWNDTNVRGRMSGSIDDVRIYDTAITAGNAAWLAQNRPVTSDADYEIYTKDEPEIAAAYIFDKSAPADVVIPMEKRGLSLSGEYLTAGDYSFQNRTLTISADYLMNRQPGAVTFTLNGTEKLTVNVINSADGYPIVYYKGDGENGLLKDCSGNGMDGEVIRAAVADGVITFDGYQATEVQQVRVANTDYLSQTIDDQATISLWFKAPLIVGNHENLAGLYAGDRPALAAQFRDAGGERKGANEIVQVAALTMDADDRTWNKNYTVSAADPGNTAVETGEVKTDGVTWHQMAVVYDGSKSRVYLDGAKVAEGTAPADALAGVDSLVLGGPVNGWYVTGVENGSQNYHTNYHGSMDEVLVYNTALTETEVADLYTAGRTGITLPLDTTGLKYLVVKAEGLDSTQYTAATWETMAADLTAAKTLLAGEAIDRESLDQAAAALLNSINSLKAPGSSGGSGGGGSSGGGGGSAPVVVPTPEVPEVHVCPSAGFYDVAASNWFHEAVDTMLSSGLMAGMSQTSFGPSVATTRGMIVTILYSLEGKPAVSGDAFEDVNKGDWYFDAVNWAASNGIVAGYGEGKFGPGDNVTREQLVAILMAYAKYKGYDVSVGESTNILSYNDFEQISEWAIPAVQWGCGAGIISGKGDGILDPAGSALRAEVAQMMMKFIELY